MIMHSSLTTRFRLSRSPISPFRLVSRFSIVWRAQSYPCSMVRSEPSLPTWSKVPSGRPGPVPDRYTRLPVRTAGMKLPNWVRRAGGSS